jgi:homoserine kinase type II
MAVYTQIGEAELASFLDQYEVGEALELEGIRQGVENSNYRLRTTLGCFILTIYEKRVDPKDLPFFLGLMEHLARRGLPCPLPVAGRDGRALRRLAGKPAAIVTFLAGTSPGRLTRERCAAVGEALASMHLAAAGFPLQRPNALALVGWRRLFDDCRARADSVAPGLAEEIAAELEALGQAWPRDLPAGVIHADLFPDNVFFDNARVTGLIDFYFACNDLLAYDLAICLNAWCFDADHAFNVTNARALLAGYCRARPLAAAEIRALPVLCRGSALRFLLTRLFDWLHQVEGALVKPKDPLEYLRRLRFHRQLRGPEAYGLD